MNRKGTYFVIKKALIYNKKVDAVFTDPRHFSIGYCCVNAEWTQKVSITILGVDPFKS